MLHRRTKLTSIVLGFGSATLLLAAPAFGEEAKNLEQKVDLLAKDVAELRGAIGELVALETRKLELLAKLSAMAPPSAQKPTRSAPEPLPVTPPPEAPRSPPHVREAKTRAVELVTLHGRVALPAGQIVGYVYVADIRGRPVKNAPAVVMRQVNKQFQPSFAVVQRGMTVEFPNFDPIYHNVFSTSPGNSFDLGIYRKGDETKSVVMTAPGVVDIYCNMHSQMQASVLVVPGPLFARVGPDGTFAIPNVPAGRHKLAAWSPGAALAERTVEVANGSFVDFSLAAKDGAHTNKFGMPYGSYR
ncbi:MAG: hypothetical protein HYV07_11070 [Deltaproteobacteria bacterium]|nr:hypothetical protein [Deltaproteobacteria bacterium]